MLTSIFWAVAFVAFKLRRQIEKTKTAGKEKYSRSSNDIKTATMDIAKTATALREEGKISEEDYRKIINVTGYLLEYFSRKYADLRL